MDNEIVRSWLYLGYLPPLPIEGASIIYSHPDEPLRSAQIDIEFYRCCASQFDRDAAFALADSLINGITQFPLVFESSSSTFYMVNAILAGTDIEKCGHVAHIQFVNFGEFGSRRYIK